MLLMFSILMVFLLLLKVLWALGAANRERKRERTNKKYSAFKREKDNMRRLRNAGTTPDKDNRAVEKVDGVWQKKS